MKWGVLVFFAVLLPSIAAAATNQPPSCVISTPPGVITAGNTARIIWYTENAQHAYVNGMGEVSLQGYRDVRPNITTTYPMTVTGQGGTRACSVTVSVAPQSSLLYYNSPQAYTYSPNQIFWSPIYVPPRYVDGSYHLTNDWYDDTYEVHDIDSNYIPGTSYVLTTSYLLPNGDQYDVHEHCVAGLDCITVGSTYSWLEDAPAVLREPAPAEPTSPAPSVTIPSAPSANRGMSEEELLRLPNPNPNIDQRPYSPSASAPEQIEVNYDQQEENFYQGGGAPAGGASTDVLEI